MGNELLKQFLKKHEGQSDKVYPDSKGIPTIGIGGNLQSPEMEGIAKEEGLNLNELKSGQATITPEQQENILNKQIAEKERYFNNIRNSDFPDSDISDNERAALLSAGFNSPTIWGPKMRGLLQQNDDAGASKELMLRSNKNKSPGIAKRRLGEAKMFSGDGFQDVVDSLTDEERTEIKTIINNIKNPHERMRVLSEYPFLLDEYIKQKRFKKVMLP